MSFTFDSATALGKVRALIGDTDETAFILSDEQLQPMLDLEENEVKAAAALALETIASKQVLVMKVMRILDIQLDGAKVAADLRSHARELRRQWAEETEVEVVEALGTSFSYREYIRNLLLKEGA